MATGIMLTDLGVKEYTINIQNSPLCRLQAGVPCARGGKCGHRAHAEGPPGHRVPGSILNLALYRVQNGVWCAGGANWRWPQS